MMTRVIGVEVVDSGGVVKRREEGAGEGTVTDENTGMGEHVFPVHDIHDRPALLLVVTGWHDG